MWRGNCRGLGSGMIVAGGSWCSLVSSRDEHDIGGRGGENYGSCAPIIGGISSSYLLASLINRIRKALGMCFMPFKHASYDILHMRMYPKYAAALEYSRAYRIYFILLSY